MLLRVKHIIFILSVATALISCKKNQNKEVEDYLDFSYTPAYEGYWRIYDVESLLIDAKIGVRDTVVYEMKEIYESSFLDKSGNTVYRIERYRRDIGDSIWMFDEVIRDIKTDYTFDRIVDNQRIVNVVYPLIRNYTWDGLMYLDRDITPAYMDNWLFLTSYFNRNGSINDINFDSTLYVEQINISDVHILRSANEIYAKDVGLIFKKIAYFDSQNANQSIDWSIKAEKGFSVTYSIKDYKK